MKRVLVIDPHDNVANAMDDIQPGESFTFENNGAASTLTAVDQIPYGFKVAVRGIKQGEGIMKYHECIGQASRDIKAGECVHIHNVEGARGRGDLEEKNA